MGPHPANTRWLDECIDSIDPTIASILLVDDTGNDVKLEPFRSRVDMIYKPPWRLGVGHAFNFGVALAKTECVFMLGSDDYLHPSCLNECWNSYIAHNRLDAYYSVTVKYINSGQVQQIPCNAAMVTKGFWKMTGGFPVACHTAPDAALLSICMAHKLPVVCIPSQEPLYYYRDHPETDTIKHAAWHDVVIQVRNLVTLEWQPQC